MSLHSFEPSRRDAASSAKAVAGPQLSFGLGGASRVPAGLWAGFSRPAVIGGVLVLLMVLGGIIWATRSGGPAVPAKGAGNSDQTVTAIPITRLDVVQSLEVNGSIRAFDELPLGTETSGIAIRQVLVDEGDHVRAGQLLARFNDDLLLAEVNQKQALLREAQANAAEGSANAKRAEELLKSGAISQRDADNRRALAASAEARVGVAQASLAQAQARLRQADIRAPADGVISWRGAREGAVMSAGGPELFRLLRDGRLELAAELVERDLSSIKPGQVVSLSVDGPEGSRAVTGAVRLVSPLVDPKTHMGLVRIDVPADAGLRAGMFLRGRIALGNISALVVPEPAVVYLSAKPTIFVVDAEMKAHARRVDTGARQDGMIAISGQIAEGERVVMMGAGYLKEGDKIVIADKLPDAKIKPMPQSF